MKRMGIFGLAIVLSAACALAQQGVGTPILVDAGATRLSDEKQDGRIDQRPLAQEDQSLRTGRELKQGEAVAAIRPPPQQQADPSSPRVRARALLEEDRSRVKREAALME
ncbi:MAG: hypothetical protein AB7V14_02125 [Kiritimatiellia bacterium]